MRRKDREITSRNDIIEIIKEESICRLAIMDEAFPYIVPMNYGIDVNEGEIALYFHSANEGKKIELIRRNNHVAFEIDRNKGVSFDADKGTCSTIYESVVGNGFIEFVDEEEKRKVLRLILRKNGRGDDFPIDEKIFQRTECFKLIVKEFTGKKH